MEKIKIELDVPVRTPAFCSIELLYSCILRCKMCYMWKNPRAINELSIENWKKFILALKKFTDLKTSINITGGEPLFKENIIGLVKFIVQQGFTDVSMTTNGFLIDKTIAKEIAESGLGMLSLSLDSINEDTHDYLRGVNGVYRKVIESLNYFEEHKGYLKKIGIQTIIMGPNLEGILDLVEWAHKKKISIYFMAIVEPLCLSLKNNWYRDSEYSFLWPQDTTKLYKVIDELILRKEKGVDIGNSVAQLRAFKAYFASPDDFVKKEKKCKMGDGMLKVGPMGDVSLCGEKGAIGNIRNSDICDIWFSEKAKCVREAIKSCKTNCPQLINCYFED